MTWLPLSQLNETEHSWRIQGNTVQFGGTGTYRKLRGCDPATFEVFAEPDCLIARDRNHVYHGAELLAAVQRDSFAHLGEGYWRDANAIYCEYETSLRPLKGSDAAISAKATPPTARKPTTAAAKSNPPIPRHSACFTASTPPTTTPSSLTANL